MKKITKTVRFLTLVLAICLFMSCFAACGDETGDAESNASNSSTSSEKVQVPSQPEGTGIYADPNYNPYANIPESSKGATVRYATWIDHTTTEGAKPLENFNRDTGLNVTLYQVPQDGYVNTLMTKMQSGDIPDVYVTSEDNQSFPLTLQIGAPIDLVSTVDLQDPIWDQSMLETGKINGHYYLLNTLNSPWSGSNLVYFNRRIFEENGIKSPAEYYEEGNWTWVTMQSVMREFKALNDEYIGGYIDPEVLGGSAGASFIKYDYKTNKFSSGASDTSLMATYQYYAGLRDQELVSNHFMNSIDAFKSGRLGIMITGVYGLKSTGHFMGMDAQDIGYTYLPSLEDGSKGLTSSIHRMYGICEKAPNADAAGYFIRYWLDYKNYDLEKTFISVDAGNFYYELINQSADKKYFNFDFPCANLIGEKSSYAFTAGARVAVEAGVKTEIDQVVNKVNKAVDEANKLVEAAIENQKNYNK